MKIINQTTETTPIDAIRPHPRNPRQGDIGAIHHSIQNNGFYGTIIAQRSTGYILAGNHRWQAAQQTQATQVPVTWVDVDDDHALRILLADNRTNDLATYNDHALAEILEGLRNDTGTLDGTGYNDDDLDDLLADLNDNKPKDGLTDPDDVPETPEDPITKPGDLWVLGRHRLLCGDSTNIQHVERLMDGEKADMVFTDPPYSINYQSIRRTKSAKFAVLKNDDKIISDWLPLANAFSSGFCFVWTTWKVLDKWLAVTKDFAPITNMVVWNKGGGGIGDLKKTYSTDHEIALVFNRGADLTGKRIGSVWDIGKDRATDYVHPTQKPVALAEQALDTTTKRGSIVLDFFGGSGSTLIACEKTNRHCRMMEIDPIYCDVIIKRWEDFTGQTAQLQN